MSHPTPKPIDLSGSQRQRVEAPVRHGGSARLKACSRYYLMPAAERSEFDRYSLVYARGGWGRRGDQKLQAGVGLGEVLLYARGNRKAY